MSQYIRYGETVCIIYCNVFSIIHVYSETIVCVQSCQCIYVIEDWLMRVKGR